MIQSREWHLVRRPDGTPTDDDVELATVEVPNLDEGKVRIRNLVMSVEPYMRGLMESSATYREPFALGQAMTGRTVGRVEESRDRSLSEGTLVITEAGWREVATVAAEECVAVREAGLPPSVHLGVLGGTGMTAWLGLRDIAKLEPSETVFVSSAAGAVGSTAVQIAKSLGCTVIGSAGSATKVEWLRDELGVDGAFCYRDGPARKLLPAALEEAGVDGIDVYFDNVGGEQLEAAIRALNVNARVALCGMISIYNATKPVPGPRNLIRLVWQRARMEGFLLGDHEERRPAFEDEMMAWLDGGSIRNVETMVTGGIEAAWPAFLQMLGGDGIGKTIIDLAG